MTARMRKGQAALLGMLALALVVALVMYSMLSTRKAESEARTHAVESEAVRKKLTTAESALEHVLDEAVAAAAQEMAAHGGFTRENVPPLSRGGVPYWFYEGKVVNVPTTTVMEQMMVQKVERNVQARIGALGTSLRLDAGSLGFPRVNVTIRQTAITSTMAIPIRITDAGNEVSTDIKFSTTVPLRLGLLHDVAERYVRDYAGARTMEDSILDSITQDPRIPNPGGECCMPIPSCDSGVRYRLSDVTPDGNPRADHESLVEPFLDHARLAAANEMRRVRQADLGGATSTAGPGGEDREKAMEYLEWSFDLPVNCLSFSFVANEGHPEYQDTGVIYLYKVGPFGLSPADGCQGGYELNYTIHFPVELILRDLMPSANVVGGAGSNAIAPLELKFFMEPYLLNESPAVNDSVDAPASVDDQCQGACSLAVELEPPDVRGTLWLDGCRYRSNDDPAEYASGTVWRHVPCGVHDIAFEAMGAGYARSSVQATTGASSSVVRSVRLPIRRLGAVTGRVLLNDTVYCVRSQKVQERGTRPLGYIATTPPAYVEVHLFPLDAQGTEGLAATTDEEGRFEFPLVDPGRFLLLAVPSSDGSGRPLHMVLARGMIVAVDEGPQEIDVVMRPITVERDESGAFHNVASRDEAC